LIAALFVIFLLKRDIKRINGDLRGITATDTNARLTTDTFDRDISRLIEGINAMLERNRRDLFEKVRAETDLKRAVTNISHDLRTPLTSALGYLQMLESGEEETKARYIKTIRGRLEALSVLTNSLFEFAKIMEENTVFDMRKVNAGSLLRETLTESYPELTAKGFEVEADIPDEPVFFYCDRDALRRVLQNLIKNVCVHGRDYLRVSLRDGTIEIVNKADGLEAMNTGRIFQRFYTSDASRSSRNTGLGLAIVKELVTRMGGEVTAMAEGEMLTVRVRFNGAR
jgi:signal transduction histidine kinase